MSNLSTRPHAAIDIGTNSMHLLIAQAHESGVVEFLTSEKISTRLGQNMSSTQMISAAAMDRALETLDRFVKIAEGFDADVSAIATSAVREANNREEFIRRAKELTGIDVETISGVEEARLIQVGVSQALDIFDKTAITFDIGGGSTEFIVAYQGEVLAARSLKLGCIRLTDMFFPGGATDAESFEEARRYIRNYLALLQKEVSGYDFGIAIGSSGTVGAIAEAVAELKGSPIGQLNNFTFTLDDAKQVSELICTLDSHQRGQVLNLDSKRVDIIVGGAAILLEIMQGLGISEVTVSSYALREGILFDRLLGSTAGSTKNLRLKNANKLMEQLDNDPAHATQVSKLAMKLYDQLSESENLPDHGRELLEVAALLHNVGLSISHTSHHKHSYYIIKHADSLTGFTEREIELVAQIARFNRRAKPSESIPEFARLSSPDRRLVRVLAGILRIAIGLDRRHLGLVDDLSVERDEKKISINLVSSESDLDLEIYSATSRSELLVGTLGTKIDIQVAE